MIKQRAHVGIDVAFAKKKRLPICVCVTKGMAIEPLPLRVTFEKPPAGQGNRAGLNEQCRQQFADAVVQWLKRLEVARSVVIERIAIDAPRDYANGSRRAAECAMDADGVSCFTTPTKDEFDTKIRKARAHLAAGGTEAMMPSANQLWMLVGFELFRVLEKHYDCIEVFPQAIVRAIGCAGEHKSTKAGFGEQVRAFANVTGQGESEIEEHIGRLGFGSKHDRLDAYLSAWVASLPATMRIARGAPPDDVIWIPDAAQLCATVAD